MSKLAKGFTCKCGKFHRFSGYVYANWDTGLVKTCAECGRRYRVLSGVATLFGGEDE